MDWTERVNFSIGEIPLGSGRVELLEWSHVTQFTDNRPHRHTFFEVCLVGAYGEGQFIVQAKPIAVRPGCVFIARPGILHQIVNTGVVPMELFWVCYQLPESLSTAPSGDIDRLLGEFADSKTLVVDGSGDGITSLWKTIQTILDGPAVVGRDVQLLSLASALIIAVAQKCSTTGPGTSEAKDTNYSEAIVRRAIRFIHDNIDRPLTVTDIADQMHISPRHLNRLVVGFTGTPPAKLVTAARLDKARALLYSSTTPIKEIAVSVGYADVHHFTRAYSTRFECSPGETRRRCEFTNVRNIQKNG